MILKKLVAERRFREAVECYHSHESLVDRRNPERQLLAADAAARLGELTLGQQLAVAAFEQFASTGRHQALVPTSNLLGAIAFERGQVGHAHGYFSKAILLARRHDDLPMLARVSNNLATLTHFRGGSEAAIPLYQESARLFEGLEDPRGEAEASHNLGLLFRQLDRLEEADAAATKAVRLAESAHDRSLQALATLGQAEVTIEREDFQLARHQIVRGAALAAEADDQLNGIEAGRLRALLTFRQGDFAIAHHLAEVAGCVAGNLGSGLLRAECAALSALALRGLGRMTEAAARREEAVGAFQDFGAQAKIERLEKDWPA